MIGLSEVKTHIRFLSVFKISKARKEAGFETKDEISLNMIILGNPGTEKHQSQDFSLKFIMN